MLHSICQQIWKTQQWPQGWKKSVFIPIPKKGNAKECSSLVQLSLFAQLCLTLCNPMNCSMPGLPVHHQLPEFTKLMSIESLMPSNHLILCRPLLPPSIFPSIRVFSDEAVLRIRWPKYWSFSFNIKNAQSTAQLHSSHTLVK